MNTKTQNKESQAMISPSQAIELLKEGNKRFINNEQHTRDYKEQIDNTAGGQWPYAAVLSCIDSRVPVETIFDQGIGDVFSARVAGNFVNDDILGSLEYSCKVAGSKAIVILGHSGCGAVKGACDHVELGKITGMLANLMPAVDGVTDIIDDRTSANATFVQKVVEENVRQTVHNVTEQSEVLKEMVDNGEVMVVGAVYDVSTGVVSFM
ncbi:MAG: carbonic anhydrase [Bacteroidia bacterium]